MINAVLKSCLRLLLVGLYKPLLLSRLYAPRAENGQKIFVELVDTRGQGLFNKDCLNILRDKDLRKRDGPSTENSKREVQIL